MITVHWHLISQYGVVQWLCRVRPLSSNAKLCLCPTVKKHARVKRSSQGDAPPLIVVRIETLSVTQICSIVKLSLRKTALTLSIRSSKMLILVQDDLHDFSHGRGCDHRVELRRQRRVSSSRVTQAEEKFEPSRQVEAYLRVNDRLSR